jgi:hypothetical protein
MTSLEVVRQTVAEGGNVEKLYLYKFDATTSQKQIATKFKLFSRACYPRYFRSQSAAFHDDFVEDMVASYYGRNRLIAAFRGSAKTSLKKLFDVFVLLNDRGKYRKYMKVLTKDGKNSRQIVTDVYNLIVELKYLYGDVFEHKGDMKREETMTSFTMKDGRKYAAGTVGQTQRGHVQDAYRPDWVWFEDVEDRESIRSMVVTQSTIGKIEEAIDGLSVDGSYFVTCNYISDVGVIQDLMNRPSVKSRIVPLLLNDKDNRSATWAVFTPEKIDAIRKDAKDFFGEYQCDPRKSENKFFDLERVANDLKNAKVPARISAGVRYWGVYLPHHRYGMGSDHSEGGGGDANAMALFDFNTGELVADYANNTIGPDLATHEFARVGGEFGNCIYAPEVNASCGGVAITTLKSLNYPQIFVREDDKKIKTVQTDKLGWETNSRTKYTMMFEFRKDYNDGLIKIYDADILREMKAYSNSDLNDSTVGLITRHFDLLMATVIAWQMRKHSRVVKNNYKENYQKYINSNNP